MDFKEISILVDPHKVDPEALEKAESTLVKKIALMTPEAYEDRGTAYYYLIRIRLSRSTPLDDEKLVSFLDEMTKNFQEHEKIMKKSLKDKKDLLPSRVKELQLGAFYKLVESRLLKIEEEFDQKGFFDRLTQTYQEKMLFRQHRFFFQKKYGRWFLYWLWKTTSRYGESFAHWGLTNLVVVFGFAILFYFIGQYFSSPSHEMIRIGGEVRPAGVFNYFYYSVVTFTTLGYGDITPISLLEKVVGSLEVMIGYVMLGVFLTILHKRL